jgi:polygalacturonase
MPGTDGGTGFSDPGSVKVPVFGAKTCPVAPGGDINAAIAACSVPGGGTVTFSAGNYSTGSIHMMSNVKLDLRGATITASGGIDGAETDPQIGPYPNCEDDGHRHWHNALIWGENVTNLAVVGPGTINGPGLDTNAQKLIAFKNSSIVMFDDLTMSQTGHFALLMTNVVDLTLSRLTITPSRDGVDLMECSNVNAHDLNVTGGGDDSFALKSDCTVGKPITTNNVTVSNSTFGSGANAMQIGSETWGDFTNISWSNNKIIRGGKSGIGIQMNDGAVIRNMSYDHITMSDTAAPIFLSVTSILRAGTRTPGHAENIHFSNITATNVSGGQTSAPNSVVFLSGEPNDPNQGIFLENVQITFAGGGSGSAEPPEGSTFTGPSLVYNPRYMQPVPGWASYVRHGRDVEFHNCNFTFAKADSRPAVFARDVEGLTFETFTAMKGSGAELTLDSIRNLVIKSSPPLMDVTVPSVAMMSY